MGCGTSKTNTVHPQNVQSPSSPAKNDTRGNGHATNRLKNSEEQSNGLSNGAVAGSVPAQQQQQPASTQHLAVEQESDRRGGGPSPGRSSAQQPTVVVPSESTDLPGTSPKKVEDLSSPKYEDLIPLKVENIADMLASMESSEVYTQLVGVISLRKLLCGAPPPIDEVIQAEQGAIIPRLIVLMETAEERVQFEAAWCLTNIASGTSVHTHVIVDSGAIAVFAKLCSAPTLKLRDQAVWALGNIAGDSDVRCRDEVLKHQVLSPILKHTRALLEIPDPGTRQQGGSSGSSPSGGVPSGDSNPPLTPKGGVNQDMHALQHATWALTNLCRGNPPPQIEQMSQALPVLISMLSHWDLQVQADGAWGLSYLSAGSNDRIEHFLTSGPPLEQIGPYLSMDMKVATPILRYIGNLVAGEENHTQAVMDAGLLPYLLEAYHCQTNRAVQKEVMWTLSNCMAGTTSQIQSVLDAGLVPSMVACISGTTDLEVKKEAVWAFGNAAEGGTLQQKQFLVDCGCVRPLCDLLHCEDQMVTLVVMTALCGIVQHDETTPPTINHAVLELLYETRTFERVRCLAQEHATDPTYADKAAELLEVEQHVFAEQEAAAIRIQAVQRGKVARKEVEELKAKQLENTTSPQEESTSEVMTEGQDMEDAALKIQAVQRGRTARKEVANLKEHKQQEEAAVKIQAVQRGKVARKEVEDLKANQTIQKDALNATNQPSVQTEAVAIESSQETEEAAVKIQAIQRGRADRKKVEELKEHKQQEEAAVKIQAVQRGKVARKEVEEMKVNHANQETVLNEPSVEKEATIERSQETEDAAVKIQAIQRGRADRKKVEELKEHKQQEEAAVKIQAVQRGKVARKEVEELKQQKVNGQEDG